MRTTFPLVKTYGDAAGGWVRRISKPVAGTVTVSVNGSEAGAETWSLDAATGVVTFGSGHVPPVDAAIRAGFEFDVPVRFDTDRIDVDLGHFEAGRIPSIPLTEILP